MAIPNTKYDPLTKGSAIKQAARNPAVSMADNPLAQLRHFSGGGTVAETPEQLMARMAHKYGTTGAAQAAPEPAAPPTQQPAKAPASGGMLGGVVSLLKGRKEQIDKAAGFRNGGKIKGPGSPTSDSIAAQVKQTGEPIAVSTDERILSKAQDAALEQLAMAQGFESLDAMLEAMTGQPVGPTISAEGKKAATGMAPEQNPLTANAPYAMGSAADPHAVTAQSANPLYTPGGANDPHASFATAPARPSAAPASPIAATPRQTPNMMMPIDTMFPEKRFFANGGKIDPNRDYSIPEEQQIAATQAIASAPKYTPPAEAPIDLAKNFRNTDFSMAAADPKGFEMVRKTVAPGTPTAAQASAAIRSPSVNPLMAIAPGVQERTFSANAAASPLAAPTSPNAVSAPQAQQPGAANPAEGQKQNSFTEVGKASAPLQGPLDAHGNSMAATNEMKAQLAEMTRTAPANVVMLENSGLKDTQELMDKWGRQDMQREMLQEISRNPRAANAIAELAASANNTEAQIRGQSIAAATGERAAETTRRGQDIEAETARRGQEAQARTDAARLAGNLLENQLKSVQVQAGQSALDRSAEQDKALAAIRDEQDPVKRQAMIEAHLAGQGKNPLTDRYLKVEGGEEIGPDGMTKIKRPSGVYDTVTQQFKPMDAQQGRAQQYTITAEQRKQVEAALPKGMTFEQYAKQHNIIVR